ncbi:MAG: OmpA family protein, partial [Leptospiraceae bacterium]|nr:OmpA family protein [Leptospiraceae bacterium]
FNITCLKKGYMYYAHKFWPDEKSVHEENITLMPLKKGLKTDVREITFLGDETEIYHKSKPALDELIEFLHQNPGMKLAIIGHVNGPDKQKSENFYRKASMKRAQSVVDYLIKSGISKDRLEARGAGNTQMIYPNPKTDWQSEANRRIEIEVIDL